MFYCEAAVDCPAGLRAVQRLLPGENTWQGWQAVYNQFLTVLDQYARPDVKWIRVCWTEKEGNK
jgi:hypothetical protein